VKEGGVRGTLEGTGEEFKDLPLSFLEITNGDDGDIGDDTGVVLGEGDWCKEDVEFVEGDSCSRVSFGLYELEL
jgi:hypothetical protein